MKVLKGRLLENNEHSRKIETADISSFLGQISLFRPIRPIKHKKLKKNQETVSMITKVQKI